QFYYYLWQLTAIPLVRRLHREVGFDVVHHVTFGKCWAPSALAFLDGVPFVWGPVGGGEFAPLALWCTFGLSGIAYETVRTAARFLAALDPLVRLTTRRASLALASAPETAVRLKRLGVKRVEMMPQLALPPEEIEVLSYVPPPPAAPVRFLSVGRLLHWKGFHLGLKAFARSGLNDVECWIVGEGPERRRLEALARRLGLADRVRFFGQLPRQRVLELLGQVHALIHPSLHDQSPTVCLEAMAAGRPVICLDLGGPAVQVTEESGIKVPARSPSQVVSDLAAAMQMLASDPDLRARMGERGRRRVEEHFLWPVKADSLTRWLIQVAGKLEEPKEATAR
ncbi:MAG: glycosyltransferase family 4 protein, partial [Armatimonadota bacterium]|nr:glycosyltransferase family 4 protein [Armatimonadota bacterium]